MTILTTEARLRMCVRFALLFALLSLSGCAEYLNTNTYSAPGYEVYDFQTLDFNYTKHAHDPSDIPVFTSVNLPQRSYVKVVSFGVLGNGMTESDCVAAARTEAAKYGVDAIIVHSAPMGTVPSEPNAGGMAVVGVVWTSP